MDIRPFRIDFVKAIDGTTLCSDIEIRGPKSIDALQVNLPSKNPKLISVKETKIASDIEICLEDDLYQSIFGSDQDKKLILSAISDAEVPDETIAEYRFLAKVDNHSVRHILVLVALATKMAMDLSLRDSELLFLIAAALTHDYGKSRISPEILCSNAFLTEDEIDQIRSHPIKSWLLAAYYFSNDRISQLALAHHERRDGSGYPFAKKVNDRAVGIIQVCDMFDALISPRSYRTAFKLREVLDYLSQEVIEGRIHEDAVKLLISYVRSDRPDWSSVKVIKGRTSILGRQGSYRHIR